MNVRFANLSKFLASVEGAHGVPLEIPQAHRQPHLVSHRQAVPQDACSKPTALVVRQKVEVVEQDVIWVGCEKAPTGTSPCRTRRNGFSRKRCW